MANIIEQVNVAGVVYNLGSTAYAVCNTAASEAAKVIQIDGISLVTGLTIHVKFNNANTADNPTLTITGGDSAANTPIDIVQYGTTKAGKVAETTGWQAGAIVSLTYDGTSWIKNSGYNTNSQSNYGNITTAGKIGTTADQAVYTTTGGLVTAGSLATTDPTSGGNSTAFTFIDTVSQNSIGKISATKKAIPTVSSSTAGLAPKGAAVSSQSQTTKFLREDGTWAAPSYTAESHYTANLIVGNASTDTADETVSASTTGVYLNLIENNTVRNYHQLEGAGGITIGAGANGKITFTGKAGTVTSVGVTANGGLTTSITNNGAITTSGTIGIAQGGVTNSMLANDWMKIGTVTKHLGETFELSDLGIARAMNFIGITKTALTDGATTATLEAKTTGSLSKTTGFVLGDVVLYGDAEYIWQGSAWELLGDETAYAPKSTAVTNVAWDGTNNKLTKTINGSTSDVVTISTIKTALALAKADVGLGNVTNHQQVHEVAWDSTNKKITRSKNGSAGDVVSFVQGTNVTLTGASGQLTIAAADPTVSQTALAYNGTNADQEYAVLFKNTGNTYTTETAGVKFASTENKRVTINPSTGAITAAKFIGDGSSLTGVTASSVAWNKVTSKVYAYLYVNATAAGANNDTAATDNSNTYIHLYDDSAVRSTIRLIGAGGTSISSTASSKNITITSKKYKSTGSANALTSLKLKYTDSSAHDDSVSTAAATPSALGTVTNAVLYIKSLYYGTTSVSTGVSEDNT